MDELLHEHAAKLRDINDRLEQIDKRLRSLPVTYPNVPSELADLRYDVGLWLAKAEREDAEF